MKRNILFVCLLSSFFFNSMELWSQTLSTDIDTVMIDSSLVYTFQQSICIDNKENIHVIWVKLTDSTSSIYYSKKDFLSETWSIPIIISGENSNIANSGAIALDGNDNPHIVYVASKIDEKSIRICHLTLVNNIWINDTISSDTIQKKSCSISIDGNGNIHVIWIESFVNYNRIVYSNNINNYWSRQSLQNENRISFQLHPSLGSPSLGVSSNGIAYLSYIVQVPINNPRGICKFVYNNVPDGKIWQYDTINIRHDNWTSSQITIFEDSIINLLISLGYDPYSDSRYSSTCHYKKNINTSVIQLEDMNVNGILTSIAADSEGKIYHVQSGISTFSTSSGLIYCSSNRYEFWNSAIINGPSHSLYPSMFSGSIDISSSNNKAIVACGNLSSLNVILLYSNFIYSPNSISKTNYENPQLRISPNPFNEFTIINFQNKQNKKHSLIVYDITGNIIYQIDNITSNSVRIERNNLSKGLFLVRLIDDEQKSVGVEKLLTY